MVTPFFTRSEGEPVDSSLVLPFFSGLVTGQYFNAALLTILVYHSIVTLDKEVKFFWSNPSNFVSVIYFANRYIGILGAICSIIGDNTKESLTICEFSLWTQSLANLITVVLIDYILLIRVLAFYHKNKMLGIFLKVLLALEAASELGLCIYGLLFQEISVGELAETMTICGLNKDPPPLLTVLTWAIPMAYGVILLILALYKAAEYWRQSNGFKGSHLVVVLVQDQLVYFAFVILCCVLRIVENRILISNPVVSEILDSAGSPTLLCVLGGQLLINLKEAGERGVNGGTNYKAESVSDMQFA